MQWHERFFWATGLALAFALTFTGIDWLIHYAMPAIHNVPYYYYVNKIIIVTLYTTIILLWKWLFLRPFWTHALIVLSILQIRYFFMSTLKFAFLTMLVHAPLLILAYLLLKFLTKKSVLTR